MMKTWHKAALAAVTGMFAAASITVTHAAGIPKPGDYPKRPITIIVCFGKGGGSDQAVAAMQGRSPRSSA